MKHQRILRFEKALQLGDEIGDIPDSEFDTADKLRPMNWLWEQIRLARGAVSDRTCNMLEAAFESLAGKTSAERRKLYHQLFEQLS